MHLNYAQTWWQLSCQLKNNYTAKEDLQNLAWNKDWFPLKMLPTKHSFGEDVLNTSWRRLQCNIFLSSKMSSRHNCKTSCKPILKTSWIDLRKREMCAGYLFNCFQIGYVKLDSRKLVFVLFGARLIVLSYSKMWLHNYVYHRLIEIKSAHVMQLDHNSIWFSKGYIKNRKTSAANWKTFSDSKTFWNFVALKRTKNEVAIDKCFVFHEGLNTNDWIFEYYWILLNTIIEY